MKTLGIREPGIYKDVSIDVYHSEDGLSSTGVSLMLECPQKYYYKYFIEKKASPFKIFEGLEYISVDKDDSLVLGNLVHILVLEPEKIEEKYYVVDDKISFAKNASKADKLIIVEHIEKSNKRQIIKKSMWEQAYKMALAASSHPIWCNFDIKKGNVENSIYWDGGLYKTRLRARPDFFNDDVILDIKTTPSIKEFNYSIERYGYHRQAAMQIDGLGTIDNKKRIFGFLLVEKNPPYIVAPLELNIQSIEDGRREYESAAITYSECLYDDYWPAYGTQQNPFGTASLPRYAKRRQVND